jgi:uncharacterized phage protein (TIGR02220 family)
MTGWIKLHRRVLDHEVFQDPVLLKVFCWCLLRAAHKVTSFPVRTGRGITTITLHPGQLIFGRHESARSLGLSPSTTRRKIERLVILEILTLKTDTHFSIITIVNWNSYQSDESEEGQACGQAKDRQRTHTRIKEDNLYRENSLAVLSYLNEKTGKRYRDASFIEARLKDGGTVEDCQKIIDTKMKDPYFLGNQKYLNPRTLFRPSHWDLYLNETPAPEPKSAPGAVHTLDCPACGKTVLSSDMAGAVCILCAEVQAHA